MLVFRTRDVKLPTRGTAQSAGLDFYCPNDTGVIYLKPGEAANIPSGIKAKIPAGKALVAMNKSGVAMKKGLQVGACVIDEDYQGEMHLHVRNISTREASIIPGEKLVQMLLLDVDYQSVEEADSLEDLFGGETTERGEGGFGSTSLV